MLSRQHLNKSSFSDHLSHAHCVCVRLMRVILRSRGQPATGGSGATLCPSLWRWRTRTEGEASTVPGRSGARSLIRSSPRSYAKVNSSIRLISRKPFDNDFKSESTKNESSKALDKIFTDLKSITIYISDFSWRVPPSGILILYDLRSRCTDVYSLFFQTAVKSLWKNI